MTRSEAGFVSVVGLGVIVPFLFILLVLGVELNQFLGLRDDVQRIVDEEARVSLSRNFSSSEVTDRLRGRLADSQPFLAVSSVRHTKQSSGANEIVAVGEYRGMAQTIGGAFLGIEMPGIPFAVVSRARRANASVLLVVDRTIAPGADPCGEPHVRARIALANRLISSLRKVGVGSIGVAFTPGVHDVVERLEDAAPEVLSCAGDHAGVLRLAGSEAVSTNSLSIAYRVAELLFSKARVEAMEQRSVVMITGATPEEAEKTATTFAFLTMEARRGGISVKQVGIAVGDRESESPFSVKSGESSGNAKYLVVTDAIAREGELPGIVAHHINGRTFIAE